MTSYHFLEQLSLTWPVITCFNCKSLLQMSPNYHWTDKLSFCTININSPSNHESSTHSAIITMNSLSFNSFYSVKVLNMTVGLHLHVYMTTNLDHSRFMNLVSPRWNWQRNWKKMGQFAIFGQIRDHINIIVFHWIWVIINRP